MVQLSARVRGRALVIGAAALLAAAALAGCGGQRSGHPGSGASSTTRSTSSTAETPPASGLTLSPAQPTTSSELTFGFTAPVASGVHGSHVVSYSLSITGPVASGCVDAHEVGSPPVARGAHAQITIGPAELHAQWCAGRYSARLLELRSAHCTGSAPCPQYVSVVGLVGRTTFTIRRG